MNYLTAGESHGPQLTGILEAIPAGLHLDVDQINQALAARQGGYGRGNRQKIEHDTVEIVGNAGLTNRIDSQKSRSCALVRDHESNIASYTGKYRTQG